jgi:hypothetical protein
MTTPLSFHAPFCQLGRSGLALLALFAVSACSSAALPPIEAARAMPPIASERLDGNQSAMQQLADSDLRDMRGGLRIGGLDLAITAQVTTVASDGVSLVSELTVDDAGKLHVVASQSAPVAALALANLPAAHGTTLAVTQAGASSTPATAAAGGTESASSGSAGFIAVAGDSNTTEVAHEIMNNSITTIVSNRESNTAIDQVTDLNIAVKNFALQQAMAAQLNNAAHVNAVGVDIARFH